MLDLGWTEILVVGVVALIVIGPRDLPAALHTFGKYVGKMRSMVRDFQQGIDDIAREQELQEIQKNIRDFSQPKQAIQSYVSDIEREFTEDVNTPSASKKEDEPAAKTDDGEGSADKLKEETEPETASVDETGSASVSVTEDQQPQLGLDEPTHQQNLKQAADASGESKDQTVADQSAKS